MSARSEFLMGIKDELPILMGTVPFGLIYGVSARSAGIPVFAAQAMSFIVFGGSAQFVIAQLVGAGVPAGIIILTAFIINLRHALYSVAVAPYIKHLRLRWKVLLAYLLTDEAFAVSITHYHKQGDGSKKHWYFLGAGLALWTTWQASTAVGVVLGAQVPTSWSLDFTLPLTFIALVVPTLKERAGVAAALAAGIAAVLAVGLPFKLGLVVATLVGITIGICLDPKAGKRVRAREGDAEGSDQTLSHTDVPEIAPAQDAGKDEA